jgi:uncharacterized membrane protein SpoIIM required for sporulation
MKSFLVFIAAAVGIWCLWKLIALIFNRAVRWWYARRYRRIITSREKIHTS